MSDFEVVWDSRCGVAESPVWDAAHRRVMFCDIDGKRINALSIGSGARESWEFPDIVGSFGLCRSGRLVVSQRHHVVLFDPVSGALTDLTGKIAEPPTNRLNDGKVGPDGAFWVGSMDGNTPRQKVAALYRVTADGQVTKQEGGIAGSNGLAWSPNGRIMYHSDSTVGIIQAWDFNPVTGARDNHRILARLTSADGRPDGAATDADGNYWSAGPSAGCLNCFSPTGELLRKWQFPVPGPTMPCFADGGLYVTSLRDGKSAEVLAEFPTLGGLFRADAPVSGTRVGLFADQ
ncbi:SMP-30/gluconolactonase/LRE family protein [Rhodopila sp.]|uniref:SMP-30/gluconolactonase/LRE family protein n=1 Tax=Rhodopila sp. TaxID=2480087 RepID=UPI003D0D3ED0